MKKNKLKIKNLGFTLVELLVVISIIAILVAATSSSFINSQKRARDTSRKSELKSLSNALNMYYSDKGVFPTSDIVNGLISSQGEFADTTNPTNIIIYMKKVPKDNTNFGLQMKYLSGSKSYKLYTNLENEDDSDCQSCLVGEYNISKGCCFVITSSNIDFNTTPLP